MRVKSTLEVEPKTNGKTQKGHYFQKKIFEALSNLSDRNHSELIEHFFRHEFGKIVAGLTKQFGIRCLQQAEDSVQFSFETALRRWGRDGIPEFPGKWLYRVARNRLIDELRRSNRLRHIDEFPQGQVSTSPSDGWDWPSLADDVLRMLFYCCHEQIVPESRIAFSLKFVSGFSISEISRALLVSADSIAKRVTRTRDRLAEIGESFLDLSSEAVSVRMPSVISTIYLMFNEGYFSHSEESILRRDLCSEAMRLASLLATEDFGNRADASALMALMSFHTARFESRVGDDGSLVLLDQQDRTQWDWTLIREGMEWMKKSAHGRRLSRYHLEAAIAWEHCRASSTATTDWSSIAKLYQQLVKMICSPVIVINFAIAEGYAFGADMGLDRLNGLECSTDNALLVQLESAKGFLKSRTGRIESARKHYERALELCDFPKQRQAIEQLIKSLSQA